ncbi:MAG: hypothetical protein H6672_14470 [Anaerolineaceae bacterium]|nr:hypothetical protein [Anaerolineaceae bacterium]
MMSESPKPLNSRNLSRATLIATGMGIVGIILFVLLWVLLSQTNLDAIARLMIAFCIPPALMAGGVGVYMLLRSGNKPNPS